MSIVEKYKQSHLARNPLVIAWKMFSVISGVVGLASLTSRLLEWHGFIGSLVNSYHKLIYPVYDFLSTAVEFQIPNLLRDYITIGLLAAGSSARAIHTADKIKHGEHSDMPVDVGALIIIPLWPIALVISSWYFVKSNFDEEKKRTNCIARLKDADPGEPAEYYDGIAEAVVRDLFADHMQTVKFIHWLGTIAFGFVLILILNLLF